MPMEAMKAVDIVGAPSGSNTGHAWSQEVMSRTCDMAAEEEGRGKRKRRLADDKEEQILNSVADCTGQGKFKEMLDAKYQDTQYCFMCFRLFRERRESERRMKLKNKLWITQWNLYSTKHVLNFIESKWQQPLFQEVIKAYCRGKTHVKVCRHCSEFMRRGMNRQWPPGTHNHDKTALPMQVAIRYILSGGCTQSPNRQMLQSCIESLVYNFPNNPILLHETRNEGLFGLSDKIQLIAKQWDVFYDYEHASDHIFVSMARWLTEGSQNFMTDAIFAKKMRRIVEKNTVVKEWWAKQIPPHVACRHHLSLIPAGFRNHVKATVRKYENKTNAPSSMVTLHSSIVPQVSTGDKIKAIEQERFLIDGVSCFCMLCCKVSVISYEYHVLLKHATGGGNVTPFRDIYYDTLMRGGDKTRREWQIAN